MLNDLTYLLAIFLGFGVFLGVLGGICFLTILFEQLFHHLRLKKEKEENGCNGCQGYERCVFLFGGDLPESPCAYWEKKRP